MVGCGEAPDVAFPRTIWIGLIDLIDPPVISLAPLKRCLSGSIAYSIQILATSIYTCNVSDIGIVHIVEIGAEVHFMRDSINSRCPAKHNVSQDVYSTVGRIRFSSLHWSSRSSSGNILSFIDRNKIQPECNFTAGTVKLKLCFGVHGFRGNCILSPLGRQLEVCPAPSISRVVRWFHLCSKGTWFFSFSPKA